MTTVYVPSDICMDDIAKLKNGCANIDVIRRLGHHCVNIYKQQFESLLSCGDIEPLSDMEYTAILVNPNGYSNHTGLSLQGEGGSAFFG